MRILVVDGDPHSLSVTCAALTSDGYEVMEVSTGKDALQKVDIAHPDLVLLDVGLSDMSGLDLCRKIKSDPVLRSTVVALHSGDGASSEAQATGRTVGADGYVVKGIPNDELLARVKSLVRVKQAEDALQRTRNEFEQCVRERTAELAEANQKLVASEKSLLDRLRFDELLADISARFINLPADQIDNEIENIQGRMCELLDLDRSAVWQATDEEAGALFLTHIHRPPEGTLPAR